MTLLPQQEKTHGRGPFLTGAVGVVRGAVHGAGWEGPPRSLHRSGVERERYNPEGEKGREREIPRLARLRSRPARRQRQGGCPAGWRL